MLLIRLGVEINSQLMCPKYSPYTSQYESGIDTTVLKDKLKCLSKQYRSQKTLRRSSLASIVDEDSVLWSLRQEQRGFAQGETEEGHRSSSRLSFRARVSLVALLHHL